MLRQCQERGYAATVDVLMDIGYLKKTDYESWRNGKVPYLEKVCSANLGKLSTVLHQMRVYAQDRKLKPSFCYYKQWAVQKKDGQEKRPVVLLRFSKSGKADIEKQYATHFVDTNHIMESE